jgi:hypothetical protein
VAGDVLVPRQSPTSAQTPAGVFVKMADTMIGQRFDFILQDETRLEGTLQDVNQEKRSLTISDGACSQSRACPQAAAACQTSACIVMLGIADHLLRAHPLSDSLFTAQWSCTAQKAARKQTG